MKIKANLFIRPNGTLRVTKQDSRPNFGELGIQLLIDVPDVFFKRPTPVVNLQIPEAFLVNPDEKVIATWVAQDIAEALKLEVKSVEDGLVDLIKEKNSNQTNKK